VRAGKGPSLLPLFRKHTADFFYSRSVNLQDGWYTPLTQHVPRTASAHLVLNESSIDRSRSSSVHTSRYCSPSKSIGTRRRLRCLADGSHVVFIFSFLSFPVQHRSSAESRSHGAGAAGPVRSRSSPLAAHPGSKMAAPSPSPAASLSRHISLEIPLLPATGQIEVSCNLLRPAPCLVMKDEGYEERRVVLSPSSPCTTARLTTPIHFKGLRWGQDFQGEDSR
jgi:hypothetical protein